MYQITTMYNVCGKQRECLATNPETPTHKSIAVFYKEEDAKIKIKELADLGITARCEQFDKAWFMED